MQNVAATRAAAILAVVASLAAAGTACAGDADADWSGTISTLPGGATLVENPDAGLWDETTQWRLVEELRIGSASSEGPDMFGLVFSFDVADDGTMYVFDFLARELRAFAHDGSFLRSAGRRGGGPGEFEGGAGVRVAANGDVWVVDMQNARYTVFTGDSAVMFPRSRLRFTPPWTGGFTSDGVFHDIGAVTGGERLLRVAADGTVIDSVHVPAPELNTPRRGNMSLPLPFAPQHIRAFDESGHMWSADSHRYRLHRITLAGDTAMIITHPQQATPLSTVEQDSVRGYARMLEGELGISVADNMIPRQAPLLAWLAVDETGSLWVGLARTDYAADTADVFGADGRYFGRVALPFATQLAPRFRAGRMYVVAQDDLGTPALVRARIDRPDGP